MKNTLTPPSLEIVKEIGRQVHDLREQKHLTRKELSDKAQVSRVYIWQLEAGANNPTIEKLNKILKALNCCLEVKITEVENCH